MAAVIRPHLEAHSRISLEHVVAGHLAHLAVDPLVELRPGLPQLARADLDDEITFARQSPAVAALDGQGDDLGIGPRSDDEVVLELSLAAVEHEVDPRIDLLVTHAAVTWHAGAPTARVVAQVVVGLPRQGVLGGHAPRWLRAGRPEPQGASRAVHGHDGFVGRENERVASAPREEPHVGRVLADVRFEPERQRAVVMGRGHPRRRCRRRPSRRRDCRGRKHRDGGACYEPVDDCGGHACGSPCSPEVRGLLAG